MSEVSPKTTVALICKWYWNPLIFYMGMAGYFGSALSDMRFSVLAPFCLLFISWAMVAWIVGITQLALAIIQTRRNEPQAVHSYISSLLVAGGYGLSYLLMNNGVIVTV